MTNETNKKTVKGEKNQYDTNDNRTQIQGRQTSMSSIMVKSLSRAKGQNTK